MMCKRMWVVITLLYCIFILGSSGLYAVPSTPVSDINGDGRSDILLRSQSTSKWYYYPMDGTTALSGNSALPLTHDANWQAAGTGDFNGDGMKDILVRNSSTHRWWYYPMDGEQVLAGFGAAALTANPAWQVAGTGDLNGDGKDDVIIRSTDTHSWWYYSMDGRMSTVSSGSLPLTRDAYWQVAGVGDLNGDGNDDIVIRNQTTHRWYYYPMSGRSILTGKGSIPITASADWEMVGLADLNGDNKDDIIVRSKITHKWHYYPMNGRAVLTGAGPLPLNPSADWKISSLGDLNGDGRDDVLLRNKLTHRWYYYPMDGRAVLAGEGSAPVTNNADWEPVANTARPIDSVFAESCADAGVIGCRTFDSISSMLEINEIGVPNSPNRPLTNSKCQWNGGSDNCYPVFDAGNCSLMDSRGPRSQDSVESAKRWSPCYDSNANAARLTFWNDLGSSVQRLNAVVADPQEALNQIWTQYEIMLSPEFFFSPEGTTSSKLYRINRIKSAACRDERFADHRFFRIYPDEVTIGPVIYCAGIGYAGSEAKVTLDNARANHWIRITTHYDITKSEVNFWAYDVTTNQLLSEQSITTHQGVRLNFPDATTNIKGLNFTHHSTSHAPNPAKPSPHYWLKNAILSRDPINPTP